MKPLALAAAVAPTLALSALLALPAAQAGPTEAVHTAASAASGVATKTEHAVKKGVTKAASAVAHGAHVAGSAVSRGAKKLGLPTGPASGPVQGPQSNQSP
jgi:hypothetical protein